MEVCVSNVGKCHVNTAEDGGYIIAQWLARLSCKQKIPVLNLDSFPN